MEKINYKNLGLKIGLEIHQELSGTKLFCSCSTDLKEENKIIEIMRKIKPSIGETGEIDIASLYEEKKKKEFIYYGYENECCLIDIDDQPPNEINHNALKTALEAAMLLKLQIPNILCAMRKVITDGSAISGFQRSILIGIGTEESYILTSKGKVRIKDLYLEEDAAKIIKKEENKTFFSLSRTGIPLLEIGTQPDIKTPEQAKETAEQIGMILRSFTNIRRGIGTIRQDVNLSIKSGARIEIKGFQDLRTMPKVIENEIQRQLDLIKDGKKITPEVRKANSDGTTSYLRPMPGATRLYPETDVPNYLITKKLLDSLEIPELIADRAVNFEKKYNISSTHSHEIIKNNIPFDYYAEKYSIEPKTIANILIDLPKDIKTRHKITPQLSKKDFEFVFENMQNNNISKDAVYDILLKLAKNEKVNLSEYKAKETPDIEHEIKKLVEKNKGATFNAVMGEVMSKFKGKVDNKKIVDLVKKYM